MADLIATQWNTVDQVGWSALPPHTTDKQLIQISLQIHINSEHSVGKTSCYFLITLTKKKKWWWCSPFKVCSYWGCEVGIPEYKDVVEAEDVQKIRENLERLSSVGCVYLRASSNSTSTIALMLQIHSYVCEETRDQYKKQLSIP